jgi:hypothetical protein
MNKTLYSALLFPCWVMTAQAGFKDAEQAIKLDYGQEQATVVFEADCAIKSAEPHCDCTKVKVEGKKLIAVVDTTQFPDSVSKTIEAKTADGKKTTLHMHFDVPVAVAFSPEVLIWKVGEKPTTKVVTITVPAGSPVKALKGVGLEGEAFTYKAAKGNKKGEYTVSVTPLSTAKRVRNKLVIKMDSDNPLFTQRTVNVRVNK